MMKICRVCGRQMAEGEHFCSACGIASAGEWEDRAKIWKAFVAGLVGGLLVCAIIVAILALSGVFCPGEKEPEEDGQLATSETQEGESDAEGSIQTILVPTGTKFEGDGFDSPEEAAEAYLEAMRTGEVRDMVSTFAVETFAERFDVETMIETYNSYVPTNTQLFDSSDPYTWGINVARRYGTITEKLSSQYLLLNGYSEDPGRVVTFKDDEEISTFVDGLNNPEWMEALEEMDIGKIYVDNEISKAGIDVDLTDEATQKILANRCDMHGCDELALVLAEVELNGQEYFFAMEAACYDGVWYNLYAGGTLGTLMGISTYQYGFALQSDYFTK